MRKIKVSIYNKIKGVIVLFLITAVISSCGGGSGSSPSAVPLFSFASNLLSVEVGQSFNVSWTSTNANACNASGAWSGAKSTTGNETITINTAGDNTFTLSCTGKGGSVAKSLTIEGYRLLDGIAVDGYISSAEIFIDENDDYTKDGDEESTTTDNNGKFTDLKYANGSLISLGGTDLDSQTLLDNFLILQKLTGHTDFKAVTPVTSIAAFMEDSSVVNVALGIDSSIDVFTFDPVANKGDGGINDYLYEKGNQLTVLAFALQNITNNLNTTTETTQDYFKAITEEIEKEYTETKTKVDIETEVFVTKVFDNVITTKSVTIDEAAKSNTVTALTGMLPVIQVKSEDDITTAVIRFAISTLQTDIQDIANGTAASATLESYKSDILNYIATDQDIDASKIAPTITAIADSATTAEDTPTEIVVLANDSYPTSSPITVTPGNGSNGTTLVNEGRITYNPNTDFNGTDSFNYTINQGDKTSTASVAITVTPVNDAPSIDVAPTIQVAENQTAVTTISVSDVDDDELTLTLGGADADSFNLSTENVLTFKEAPDYETKTSYSITLTLTDGTETVTKDVTITIIDVEENGSTPVITSSASFSADENQTAIGTVTATDADGDTITYSISGSEITINSSSGVLTFASAPDYETKSTYSATVTASDGTNSTTQAITVTIIDVEENINAPVITSSDTFSADENQTAIGTVTATDADGDTITYSISGSEITINSSSGVLTFASAPDYETKSTYSATVTASDGTNSTTQAITVNVTNINDNNPVITSSSSFTVEENQTSVGSVTANDADGDSLTFALSGTDASSLSINSSSGVMTFKTAPDYETKSTYTATVTASDGVNTTTQSITVAVTYVCTSQCLYVDQSAINQYSQNNYAHFNSYNFTGEYQGNTANNPPIPDPSDKITLPGTTPVLGNQFTLEAMVYSKAHPMLIHRTIIGDDSNPASNDRERPPTITFNQVNGVNQIRYGFGVGPDSKGKRRVVNTEMTEDEWYHVAVTFDGTTSKLYLDGIEIDSSNFASGLTPHPVPITTIGRKFLGKIDEVRIWNLVRSQGEIQAAMNGSLAGDESGLVAYYPMEINENWKLIDRSPNDNHASMVDVEILQRYSSQNCTSPDGSELCPFIKIRDALESAEGGNGILVKEGKYSEVLYDELINYSYETEAPRISITGENDNVRLDGTIELNADWVFSNGRYTAQVDLFDISKRAGIKVEDIYGLWVNDRYMIPAMPINISNPTDVTTSVQNNPESGTVFALPLTTPYYYPGPHDLELQDPYIVGDINNLDAAEEWSFDKENKILYLIAGDNIPNDTNVRVRIRTSILSLEYSDNLTFKNLSFFAGTFRFHRSSYVLLEDSRFSHSWDVGMSYEMPTVRTIDELANYFHKGIHNTVRNSIFEYINDLFALKWWGSMYPLGENILFQYNDWFENTVWAPGAADNFQGASKWSDAGAIIGGSTFRYITMDQNHTGGIQPGLESLIEYARIENQYINIDGSGIQRTVGDTIGSTTRYSWLLNTNRNGMRWDSGCAGINGVAHNVVSAGNKRGFRLKGDKHRAFHLLSYDNNTNGISMPKNKFCGEAWNNQGGENMLGNLNSRLLNSINEKSLTANTPDAGDPSITGGQGGLIAQNISNEFLLNQSGIWFGEALDADHVAPFVYPHLELQDPWFENRRRSVESLESQFGVNPFTDVIQDYDFRPRKGSPLLDGGVVIPGINNGQDDDPSYPFNHPPSYSGQHRAFVGDAPDIGPYEHGDSVYWIPGFRYSYPSVPIPSNGAVDVPIDYSVMFNYPWRTDYSNTTAVVNIEGPGVNVTTTLNYPENVVFATFSPGETYNWSVTVDGVSSGNWTFTVADKIYPLNDRSFDISAADAMLIPRHNKSLQVEENVLSYLRFDIPESINVNDKIYLNITPEQIDSLDGAIVLYKYNYQGWSEKLNEKNLGVIDHSLLTFLESFSNINAGSAISIDITDYINSTGEHSFALGTTVSTDKVSFYSKEKFVTDGVDIVVSPGDLLGPSGNGSGYAPQIEVWPSLSF